MENASKALIIAGAILISILLISIGIILINSGRSVTSTGTTQMQSQEIETFNSKFTAYEGNRKGSELRSIVSEINSINATDSSHQVSLYAVFSNVAAIEPSATYKVAVHYNGDTEINHSGSGFTTIVEGKTSSTGGSSAIISEKGYIDYIVITKN